ncbi:hypothetical protein [Marinomonas sp. PE14-40]
MSRSLLKPVKAYFDVARSMYSRKAYIAKESAYKHKMYAKIQKETHVY